MFRRPRPCCLKSHRRNTHFTDWGFDNLDFAVSTDLKDGHQVGVSLHQSLKSTNFGNLQFGYKKALNKDLNLKFKADTAGNAHVFTDYKFSKNLSLLSTVGINVVDTVKEKGFLENPFTLGLKLKYDS